MRPECVFALYALYLEESGFCPIPSCRGELLPHMWSGEEP